MRKTSVIWLCGLLSLVLGGCTTPAVRQAEAVVAQADSLWQAGKMYGIDEGDSASLAQACETLSTFNSPLLSTFNYQLSTDFSRLCYHYGRLLREKDNPVAAMQVFIDATHSRTRDYHILGRVYSNIGDLCHLAGDFPLSYDMFSRSADCFLKNGDTIAYYFLLNDMAFELAEQGKKNETLILLDSITHQYQDRNILSKTLETKALLYQSLKCYDSVITIVDSLQSIDYNDVIGFTMKARAFYNLNCSDSALFYANSVVQNSPTDACAIAAYYILSHNDDTINADSVLTLTSARADAQKAWAYSQSKLAQAVQLLEQDLTRKQDWRWLYAFIGVILFAGSCAILYYIWHKRKEHSKILHEIDIKQEQKTQLENNIVAMHSEIFQLSEQQQKTHQQLLLDIESTCSTLRNSKDVLAELAWKDYAQMCAIVNKHFNKFADTLQNMNLSEREVRLCVLVLIKCYSDKQMADILCYGEKSIRGIKRYVAKKIGTSSANMRVFMIEMITQTT